MTVITITYWVWNGYNWLSFGHHSNLNWYICIEKEEWKGHLAINHKVNADSGHTNPDIHHCPLSRDIHHLKMCRCFHICFLFCPVYRVVYPFVSVERFINLKIWKWWFLINNTIFRKKIIDSVLTFITKRSFYTSTNTERSNQQCYGDLCGQSKEQVL